MKRLLSIVAILFALVGPATADGLNLAEKLYLRVMSSVLSEENKAAFSAMLYTYNVDCEPLDYTMIVESNALAAEAKKDVMKSANNLMDNSIRKMGREKWCAYFKTTIIDDIKKHTEQLEEGRITYPPPNIEKVLP